MQVYSWKYQLTIALLAVSVASCKSKEERVSDAMHDGMKKVESEQREAQKEIGRAAEKRDDKAAEVAEDIHEKQRELDQAKIDATKEMADAERKVDDEKIEATKEITDAQADARENVDEEMQK